MERQEKIAETTTLLLQQLSLAVCLLLITSLGIAGPSSTPQQDFSAAATLIKQKDYPAAINRFKEGLSKAEKGTSISEKDLIGVKFGLSTAYLLSGNMQPIGSLILPLLPDIKKLYGEVSIENATAHQMLAYAYQLSGDFQKSAYFFNQLVGLYEKMPAIPYAQRVQVLSLKADVHRQSGDYLQAIESEKRLLTVYKNHQPVDQLAIATLYGQLAALSEQLGDKDTALDYYHLQYDTVVLANGEQSPLAQSIAQNIATREEQKRDRLAGDDRSLVGALSLSAIDLSGNIGFPDSMEKIYTSTRATFGEKHPLTLNAMSKYADSLALGFKTNKAIAVYEKIIAIKQQQGAPDNDAMAGLYLRAAQAHQARIMFEDGAAHHEAALRDAHRAIKIYTDLYGDAHLRSLIALNLLWQIQRFDQTRKDENIALALRCWDAYIKLEHKILPFMSGPQRIAFRQAFAQLQDNLIETAWLITRSSAFKDAQGNDLYFPPTKIPELNLDDVPPEKHQQAMDQWIQQLKAQNESNENTLKTHNASVQKLTKAIYARWINYKGSVNAIDYELNEAKRDPHNNPHLGLITQLLDLRKRQALLATRASPEEKDDLRAVSQRITALTQKVVKRVPSLVINASLQTDDLVKSLPKKTVFIDFARYSNSEYMAFITEPSGKLTIRRLTGGLEGGDAINTGITKIRQDINAIIDGTLPFEGSAKRLDKELAKLNDALVYPMRNILAQYDTAVFSPDGLLSLIPFGLLRNQKTGKYLIEEISVRTIPSVHEWLRLQSSAAKQVADAPLTIFANPDFNAGSKSAPKQCASQYPDRSARDVLMKTFKNDCLVELPATANEAHAIESYFPKARSFLGKQASEHEFLLQKSPRILHLATHGFFLPDPGITNPLDKAGIILSGANTALAQGKKEGIVTGSQIALMNLLGTKLVVLSACETGIGDVTYGEGVAGLNQAFMRAGAKGVVMSLWRVPDVATSELMASLYEAMAKGLSPGDALRAAQLQFIHQKSHPLAWAAFIYNG